MTEPGALAALEARLRRLEDVEAARGLLHTYAQTMDSPVAARVAALFTPDGVLHTARGDAAGRAAIEEFYRSLLARDASTKRHFIVSPKATWLAPGRVRLESYFLFVGRGEARSVIGWGTYDDLVDLAGDEPGFAEKTIALHLGTDLATGWAAED